jgi:hypothetical protein
MIPSRTNIILSFIFAICLLIVYDFCQSSFVPFKIKEEPEITEKHQPKHLNILPPHRETYAINTLI